MSLTIPNTFSNGQTISASAMNANFDAVEAKFAGGQVTTGELYSPYAYMTVPILSVAGNLVAGTYRIGFKVQGNDPWIPVSFESYFYSTAGSPALSIQGSNGAINLLTSALTSTSANAAAVRSTTSFNDTSLGTGETITITVTLTTATIVDFSCSLLVKVLHKS